VGHRLFKVGQYVNTSDGFTAFVFSDSGNDEDGGPYQIAICERNEERSASASELTLWMPKPGDTNAEPAWSN
jgi:hypothetical protein